MHAQATQIDRIACFTLASNGSANEVSIYISRTNVDAWGSHPALRLPLAPLLGAFTRSFRSYVSISSQAEQVPRKP